MKDPTSDDESRHSARGRGRHDAADRIPASRFKAQCLELLDRVRSERRSIVVTKRGRPVVRVVPYDEPRTSAAGWLRGTVSYYGDLISPIDVTWEADAS